MTKKIIFCLFLFFLMLGCSTDESEFNQNGSTDYYYETGNKFIFSGHQKIKSGDFVGATADFTKAIEELPDYAYAYGFRSWSKREAKDLQGALADINKALELKNDAHDFYMWRYEIYKAMGGNDNQMNADFEKAKELRENLE